MPTSTSSILFAASLGAVAAAQGPAESAIPAPALAEALHGGGGSPRPPGTSALPLPLPQRLSLPPQDEPDYSPRGMFQQEHGDFMLQRERYNPMVELRGGVYLDGAVQGEAGRFDLYRAMADIEVPLTTSVDSFITLGGYFDSRRYQTKNMAGFADETLYAAGAKLGFGWFFDKDVLVEAMVEPGVWSDWDGTLHREDFDMPCGVLGTFRYEQDFFWKVGVRYNEIFEEANVLPWLGFSWASESVRVDVLLPEMAEVSIWPTPDFAVLFGAEIEGAEYRVRTSEALGNQQANARVQELNVYVGALWRLSDMLSFDAKAGLCAAGDYKLEDGDSATARVDGTLEPTFFMHVGCGINF